MDIERPAQLLDYLRTHGHLLPGQIVSSRLLEGGVSNRTVLVERRAADGTPLGDWVMKQALERLRVAVEWHSSPLRIHREAAGMRALGELLPVGTVPALLFEDSEHHLLAMSAVSQPHANWRDELLAGRIEPALVEQYGALLGRIHGMSRARASEYAPAFADRSFFESLRLEPYYRYAALKLRDAAAALEQLCVETLESRGALVHGDFSPKNLLVRSGTLVLLDHEVIHWGDPAFDVGFSLSHLLSKARHLPASSTAFMAAAARSWAAYVAAHGPGITAAYEDRCQRHLLACLLARVDGRSPLAYLSPGARDAQRQAASRLLVARPVGMPALFIAYSATLDTGTHARHR